VIEFVAVLAFAVACRRLRSALREPQRLDIHVHVHVGGPPGGPGEREPIFFEEPENPSNNVVPFRRVV
jgi:hypothetical protein